MGVAAAMASTRVSRLVRRITGAPGLAKRGVLFLVGYILSPLTWWNDVFVNIPLAYAMAYLLTLLLGRELFPALFAASYLATNALGFLLMHMGVAGPRRRVGGRRLLVDILAAAAYTALVYVLAAYGIISV